MSDPASPRRPIPLWRLVAGAFLHFGVLAFLVLVPLAVLLLAPADASTERLVQLALRVSAIVLAVLVAIGLGATLLSALVERLSPRRREPDSVRRATAASRRQLVDAADTARRVLDHAAAVQVAAIGAGDWDHEDHRYQALARDLQHVVATAATAISSAAADRRPLILQNAATAVSQIGKELRTLNEERARTEEAAASTAVLYVENRYGAADFSIRPD